MAGLALTEEGQRDTLARRLAFLGYSKARLARELGIHPTTVSRWKDIPPLHVVRYIELLERLRKGNGNSLS